MKTRLIQIALLAAFLAGPTLARAADAEPPREAQATATTPQPAETRDQLAWQRVGAPEMQQS
jgi:hypothetical protein